MRWEGEGTGSAGRVALRGELAWRGCWLACHGTVAGWKPATAPVSHSKLHPSVVQVGWALATLSRHSMPHPLQLVMVEMSVSQVSGFVSAPQLPLPAAVTNRAAALSKCWA